MLLFCAGQIVQIPGNAFIAAAAFAWGWWEGAMVCVVAATLATCVSFAISRLVGGDLQGGEEDLLTAIALFPDAVSPLGNLASLYFNTDRKAEARPYVRRLLDLDPDNPNYQSIWKLLQE